uniref:tRNA dihydrouridine synthase DusB n=1 Tax=Pararhizobium sp. IMCC3301 TaxID=3067904 RepID=UPI0027410B7F|nr:tRNA dihydrouridine synthase DusB [Pararhizobium sp. IMCC3301]
MIQPISIGRHKIACPVFLAPMSGVSDLPFRRLAWRYGAGLVVSEMVACEALANNSREMATRAQGEGVGIHVVQLAGREEKWMAEGARIAAACGADILDINMGCPARKVTNGYSGSALMQDPDHALRLIEATVEATALPVCLKMRLGWDENSINAGEIARRAQNAGIQLVTIHGRTRNQFYKGRADWAAIRSVSEQVDIPVIANGDIVNMNQVDDVLALSGADGIMIGRGAYGRPWFPGYVRSRLASDATPLAEPTLMEKHELAAEHYDAILSHYGIDIGIRAARKHLGWYLDDAGISGSAARRRIMTGTDCRTVLQALADSFREAANTPGELEAAA